MKIIVIGDCLFAGALQRALRGQHQFACAKTGEMEMWLRFNPEVVLVDAEAMGVACLEGIRQLQLLGYEGQVYMTQSEGVVPRDWVRTLIHDGTVKGLFTKPWTPRDLVSWNEMISSPSHQQQ